MPHDDPKAAMEEEFERWMLSYGDEPLDFLRLDPLERSMLRSLMLASFASGSLWAATRAADIMSQPIRKV